MSRSLQSMRKRSETRLQLESSRRYLDRLRDKLLAGGHNSFDMISSAAGLNFGRVKHPESLDRSIETSSITTGHNCTRAEQALLGHITSRLSSGHNSLGSTSLTARQNLDESSSLNPWAGHPKQAESPPDTTTLGSSRRYLDTLQAFARWTQFIRGAQSDCWT